MSMSASCYPSEGGHHYAEFASSPYFKVANVNNPSWSSYDHSVAYQKLYCQKCGHTIEVVARDKRKEGSS